MMKVSDKTRQYIRSMLIHLISSLLLGYVILIVMEILFPGFVSLFFDLNIILMAVIALLMLFFVI